MNLFKPGLKGSNVKRLNLVQENINAILYFALNLWNSKHFLLLSLPGLRTFLDLRSRFALLPDWLQPSADSSLPFSAGNCSPAWERWQAVRPWAHFSIAGTTEMGWPTNYICAAIIQTLLFRELTNKIRFIYRYAWHVDSSFLFHLQRCECPKSYLSEVRYIL